MTSHASVLGGSNAARLLACTASYQESLKSPRDDTSSVYADEGTFLHDIVAGGVRGVILPSDLSAAHRDLIGKALGHLAELKTAWGGNFKIIGIEQRLPFPGVPGSFGTVDLILSNGKVIMVVDWKFGGGVPVKALYPNEDEGDLLNPQLVYYTLCARAARPRLFKGKKLVLAIIQPRMEENPVSDVVTDNEELDAYQAALVEAYEQALGRSPRYSKGDHCRFAPCKVTCPLWTGAVFDLAVLNPAQAALRASVGGDVTAWGAYLGRALDLARMAEEWARSIQEQAHSALTDGVSVPGWKLVPKRANRTWIYPDSVDGSLAEIGATPEDMYTVPEIKSVAQVEKALKPRGIKIPEDLWHAVSSGTTVAPDDDPRPSAEPEIVVDRMRAALTKL